MLSVAVIFVRKGRHKRKLKSWNQKIEHIINMNKGGKHYINKLTIFKKKNFHRWIYITFIRQATLLRVMLARNKMKQENCLYSHKNSGNIHLFRSISPCPQNTRRDAWPRFQIAVSRKCSVVARWVSGGCAGSRGANEGGKDQKWGHRNETAAITIFPASLTSSIAILGNFLHLLYHDLLLADRHSS